MIMRFLFMLILSYVVIANASASDRKIYDIILFEDSVLSLSNLDAAIFNNEKYIDFFQTERKNHFEVLKDYFMDFDSILVFENIYWGEYVKSPLYNVRVIDIKKDSIYKTESDSYNNRIVVSQKKNEKFQMYNKKQDISIDVICCYICDAFIESKDSLIFKIIVSIVLHLCLCILYVHLFRIKIIIARHLDSDFGHYGYEVFYRITN